MIPYVLLLVVTFVLSILSNYYKWKNNVTICVYFVLLFLMFSLRSTDIGIDLINYEAKFYDLIEDNWSNVSDYVMEIGYGYFNKAVGYFTSDFQWFLVANAAIVVLPIYWLYSQPNEDNYLKIIILMNMGIFPMFFSGLRQSIAIALGICAFYALLRRKRLYFIAIVFVAYFFHHSSIILLLLWPLSLVEIKKKHLLLFVPIFIIFFVFKAQIAMIVMTALASSDDLAIYYERYGEMQDTGAYGTLLLFVIFTLLTYVFSDEKRMEHKAFFLRNILVLATFLQMVALINPVLMRINYYFIAFVPAALPMCLESYNNDEKAIKIIKVSLSIVLTLYYINRAFFGQDILNIYPYKYFWEI